MSDRLDLHRRIGRWLSFLPPDETAGADLDPRGGGWLGDGLRLDSPSRPDRDGRRGQRLSIKGRGRPKDIDRIRPGFEAGRQCRGGHFLGAVRAWHGCRILGKGNSTRLGPSLLGDHVPGDQDEIGQEERQDDRRDRPACRDDQDDQDPGPGREYRAYEVARPEGQHCWWDLEPGRRRRGGMIHSLIHRTIAAATLGFPRPSKGARRPRGSPAVPGFRRVGPGGGAVGTGPFSPLPRHVPEPLGHEPGDKIPASNRSRRGTDNLAEPELHSSFPPCQPTSLDIRRKRFQERGERLSTAVGEAELEYLGGD
jgi:hypothetical protein